MSVSSRSMATCAALRQTCRGVATVLGFASALLLWSLGQVLVTFVLLAFLVGLGLHLNAVARAERAGRTAAIRWRALAGPAAGAGLAGVALAALGEVSLAASALLAALFVLSSPLWPTYLSKRRAASAPPAPASAPIPGTASEEQLTALAREVDAACVGVLTQQELCRAWRLSYAALGRTSTPALRAAVVASRQAYLDEMDQRDPVGLSAWLASGARAASGPDRFLSAPPG